MSTRAVSSLFALAALVGCGNIGLESGMGVTPGGVQDIAYARDLIAAGKIPFTGDYTVEGLFSEHDLPLDGETCSALLCPRAAAAHIEPVDGSGGQVLVQLGFATALDASFERPDLDLAIAIDISGSMSGTKLDTSKEALHELVDQLDADDRMALVTYGNKARVALGSTVMNPSGRGAMHAAIDALESKGSTAMEAGLERAIEQLTAPGENARRVFLLTDAQPNVGATGVGSFVEIVKEAADDEIGVTVWGVGLDLGAELVSEMSKVRGGNAYHFTDMESMRSRVREEFDLMVSPLAYDLAVTGVAASGMTVDRTWGAPVDPTGEVSFGAATLFPSHRDGGLGVSLTFDDGPVALEELPEDLLTLSASWIPVGSDTTEAGEVTVAFAGGALYADAWAAADDLGVYKMGALVDEVLALDAGAQFCADELDAETALARIHGAAERLSERSALITDDGLAVESALMLALAENVQGGKDNCNGGGR